MSTEPTRHARLNYTAVHQTDGSTDWYWETDLFNNEDELHGPFATEAEARARTSGVSIPSVDLPLRIVGTDGAG